MSFPRSLSGFLISSRVSPASSIKDRYPSSISTNCNQHTKQLSKCLTKLYNAIQWFGENCQILVVVGVFRSWDVSVCGLKVVNTEWMEQLDVARSASANIMTLTKVTFDLHLSDLCPWAHSRTTLIPKRQSNETWPWPLTRDLERPSRTIIGHSHPCFYHIPFTLDAILFKIFFFSTSTFGLKRNIQTEDDAYEPTVHWRKQAQRGNYEHIEYSRQASIIVVILVLAVLKMSMTVHL